MSTHTEIPAARQALNFTLDPEECDLIDRAVRASGKNRAEFILDATRKAAEDTLLDQIRIGISMGAAAHRGHRTRLWWGLVNGSGRSRGRLSGRFGLRMVKVCRLMREQLPFGWGEPVPAQGGLGKTLRAGDSGGLSNSSSEARAMPRKGQGRITGRPVTTPIPSPAGGVKLETFIPWTLVKRGAKKEVITPIDAPEAFRAEAVRECRDWKAAMETPLVRALGLAHYWQHLLDTGKVGSLAEIAAAEGMDLGQVSRIARLAQLAPWVMEACLAGEAEGVTLAELFRRGVAVERSA